MARLQELYNKEMVPQLIKDFEYKNIMEVPKLEKIVVNMGLGEAIQNVKILDSAVEELAAYYRAESRYHQGKEVYRHASSFVRVCRSAAW